MATCQAAKLCASGVFSRRAKFFFAMSGLFPLHSRYLPLTTRYRDNNVPLTHLPLQVRGTTCTDAIPGARKGHSKSTFSLSLFCNYLLPFTLLQLHLVVPAPIGASWDHVHRLALTAKQGALESLKIRREMQMSNQVPRRGLVAIVNVKAYTWYVPGIYRTSDTTHTSIHQ